MDKKEKKKIIEFFNQLPLDKKVKLKAYLKTHCIHQVPHNSEIPCLICISSHDISDVVRFLN